MIKICRLWLFYIKRWKFSSSLFFNFNFSFFQNIFHLNIPLGRGFLKVSNLLNPVKCSVMTDRKISAMNKKSYFDWNIITLKQIIFSNKRNRNNVLTQKLLRDHKQLFFKVCSLYFLENVLGFNYMNKAYW